MFPAPILLVGGSCEIEGEPIWRDETLVDNEFNDNLFDSIADSALLILCWSVFIKDPEDPDIICWIVLF